MYRTFRPELVEQLVRVDRTTGAREVDSTQGIILANGVTVYRPADLLPLVDEQSNYAEGVRQTAAHERRNYAVGYTGLGVIGLGGVLTGVSAALPGGPLAEDHSALTVAGLVTVGVGLIVALASRSSSLDEERQAAFRGFDAALRHRLSLCGETQNLVDCAPNEPAAPAVSGATRHEVDAP